MSAAIIVCAAHLHVPLTHHSSPTGRCGSAMKRPPPPPRLSSNIRRGGDGSTGSSQVSASSWRSYHEMDEKRSLRGSRNAPYSGSLLVLGADGVGTCRLAFHAALPAYLTRSKASLALAMVKRAASSDAAAVAFAAAVCMTTFAPCDADAPTRLLAVILLGGVREQN